MSLILLENEKYTFPIQYSKLEKAYHTYVKACKDFALLKSTVPQPMIDELVEIYKSINLVTLQTNNKLFIEYNLKILQKISLKDTEIVNQHNSQERDEIINPILKELSILDIMIEKELLRSQINKQKELLIKMKKDNDTLSTKLDAKLLETIEDGTVERTRFVKNILGSFLNESDVRADAKPQKLNSDVVTNYAESLDL